MNEHKHLVTSPVNIEESIHVIFVPFATHTNEQNNLLQMMELTTEVYIIFSHKNFHVKRLVMHPLTLHIH